jgi:2-iminobutanoate/2-iminopropanoate deaminase
MPLDEDGHVVSPDFSAQAHRVFENIGLSLTSVGCDFGDVIKINAFLTDFEHFDQFNAIYREYLRPPYPARTTVQVGLYGFLIEVDGVARLRRRVSGEQ